MRVDNMYRDELLKLGCKSWDENLMCLSVKALNDTDDETIMSVLDKNDFKTKEQWLKDDGYLDDDVRSGCTAYVVKPVSDEVAY